MRSSVRRTDPSPRCRRHDCGGTSSNPGMAGLSAWQYTWPRWSVDFDAELDKLAMNSWRSPEWIGDTHLADQLAYFQRHRRPAAAGAGFPAPIRSETGTMPTDHRLRLQNRQSP